MQQRRLSNKKKNQHLKFPYSKVRRSTRQYGKMNKTSTRSMTQTKNVNHISQDTKDIDANNSGTLNENSSQPTQKKYDSHIGLCHYTVGFLMHAIFNAWDF